MRFSIMSEGSVKFFNKTKHFGFIAGDDGKDYPEYTIKVNFARRL